MKNLTKILATALVGAILILAIVGSVIFATSHKEGPWGDTTDVVAEQAANGVGRQATAPIINTDQGNMLVFFFTLAGVIAGPIVGYYWRKLMIEKDKERMKGLDKMLFISVVLAVALLVISGHEAFSMHPFIDPALGDVKLFTFIMTGTIIGFIIGFRWRQFGAGKQRGKRLVR